MSPSISSRFFTFLIPLKTFLLYINLSNTLTFLSLFNNSSTRTLPIYPPPPTTRIGKSEDCFPAIFLKVVRSTLKLRKNRGEIEIVQFMMNKKTDRKTLSNKKTVAKNAAKFEMTRMVILFLKIAVLFLP